MQCLVTWPHLTPTKVHFFPGSIRSALIHQVLQGYIMHTAVMVTPFLHTQVSFSFYCCDLFESRDFIKSCLFHALTVWLRKLNNLSLHFSFHIWYMRIIVIYIQQSYCEGSHSFIHSFIHNPFISYILNGYHILSHVRGAENAIINKIENFLLFWSYITWEGKKMTSIQISFQTVRNVPELAYTGSQEWTAHISSRLCIQWPYVDSLNHWLSHSGVVYTLEIGKRYQQLCPSTVSGCEAFISMSLGTMALRMIKK